MVIDFTNLVDLAVTLNGGVVEAASDEFFAAKERLILPGEPVFKPGVFTDSGKWMDGWESRRRRTAGNDWCVVRLGMAGRIRGVDIDTRHFTGNHPTEASIDVLDRRSGDGSASDWAPLLSKVKLEPNAHNRFEVATNATASHVRLNIFPDGGVARLRVYGEVDPDWSSLTGVGSLELSALSLGGHPVACNDQHYGHVMNLLRTDQPTDMGDGWETRRRRGAGHDWVIIRLGRPGVLERLEVDTTYFKGNYPDRCSVDACCLPGTSADTSIAKWTPILGETKLSADTLHVFGDLLKLGPFTHVRLNIHPDGGIARFRVFAQIASNER